MRLRRPRKSIFSRPELLDAVHVELGHDLAVLAALQRDVLDQRVATDDDPGRMDPGRALEVLDLERGVDDLLGSPRRTS